MTEEPKKSLKSWAHLRFSIIGPLLARPPERGTLQKELQSLASRRYPHPTRKDSWVTFGVSTIERWYYRALESDDPVSSLGRKVRNDAGGKRAMSQDLIARLHDQYRQFPHWSYQLHADNLAAFLEGHPEFGEMPSYSTLRREMVERGWMRSSLPRTPGQLRAADRLEKWEVRSFESEYNHALWHLDFHEGRRRVVDANGFWHTPRALCVLDDRSRLCCHIQWYFAESAENLIHGLTQAFYKRGLPRALMTDNGSAMLALETRGGLLRLGIVHETTLPHSPYQNGKQEAFWSGLEGRLMSMLSQVSPLTLDFLNRVTQAWVELDYNSKPHREIAMSPVKRLLEGPCVSRPAPTTEALRLAFSVEETRSQRRSDGSISIKGIRFEVPDRFGHFPRLHVRFQTFDLSFAHLVDGKTGDLLANIYPQDKVKNAAGLRRAKEPPGQEAAPRETRDPIPPLLGKLLEDYAATGLPPAYLPKDETGTDDREEQS
jgi:transposase InsO family protein